MLINMDLLRTLVEAGTAPTFRDAAKRLHVTPSAISHQMRALEAQLGVPLFERIGRNARPTRACHDLVASLRDDFSRIDEAVTTFAEDAKTVRGTVRIGAPGPFSRMWLRPRMIRLMREHPELVLDVRFGVASFVSDLLLAGELDLGILGRLPDEPALESKPIYVEEFVAVSSRKIAMETLKDEPFAVFDDDLAMHKTFWHAAFGKRAPVAPKIVCKVASLDELLAIAEAGVAVSVLPSYFVGNKKLHTLRAKSAKSTLHLAWRKSAHATRRFTIVKDVLASATP